jgi:hypothetical protein
LIPLIAILELELAEAELSEDYLNCYAWEQEMNG